MQITRYSSKEPIVFVWFMGPYVFFINWLIFSHCIFSSLTGFLTTFGASTLYFAFIYFLFGIVAVLIKKRFPGDGEFFIRAVAGHDLSALMEYGRMNLAEAARTVIANIGALGGTGGLIAIDRAGNISLPFNTPGMYRGYVDVGGKKLVALYQ